MSRLTAWIVAVAGLALTGCGYNQSGSSQNKLDGGYHWSSLYREDVQTVAVPIFTNKEFRRGWEFRLTEAVIKQMESHAPYKVVPRERADTVLEGQITEVNVLTLARDYRTNLPREQQLTVTIDVIWKDLRNGRILMERRGLTQQAQWYSTAGESEFHGSQDAIERLAVVIVQQMQADW